MVLILCMASQDHHALGHQADRRIEPAAWAEPGAEFVLVPERLSPRIAMPRERFLLCRLYLGLIQSMTEDYFENDGRSDSSSLRVVGIYLLLHTMMCSPVTVNKAARALKLPRLTVLRRLQELIKLGYVERVGNAYVATDKVNLPDLQRKVRRRIDLIADCARRLAELR
jgi:DNA-binding MarR family transcriptional regulator